jgi:hypothetical protein
MIVTIHQPNFFPWLGFFDKMARSDLFVLLDTVPFTKGGFQNRVQIQGNQGPLWLTVPVVTSNLLGQATLDVQISLDTKWRESHLKTFQANYGRAPGFKSLFPELSRIYSEPGPLLAPWAEAGIGMIRQRLAIRTPVIRASSLGCGGSGSRLLLDLVQAAGGTTYLSGPSGRNYLDLPMFAEAGIEVAFHSFQPGARPGGREGALPGLSALNYLFHGGLPWSDQP